MVVSLIIVTGFSSRFAFDDAISGKAKIKLSGTPTQEQIAKCTSDARARFRVQLLIWLEQEQNIKIDTNDRLTTLLFWNFVDSCINRAKATQEFRGSYWTCAYSIPPESVNAALAEYNDRVELLATHSWERLTNAITQKNYDEIYYQSVEVIAHASEYIGRALTVPGKNEIILIDTARSELKSFLERLSMTSSDQLISGKPGMPALNPPSMTVTIDGRPFSGLGMTGYIPGGRDVWNGAADHNGEISFENFIIPFAKNGTLMYVSPNLGQVLDNQWHVGVKDFGIDIEKDLNQGFFLKIDRPTFLLTFEISDPDPADTLPKEFLSGGLMKRFLADSCWLNPSVDSMNADLAISIRCQIVSANSEDLDAGEARLEGSVAVQAPRLLPPRTETETIYFEKKYDQTPYETSDRRRSDQVYRMPVPLGDFVWDANVKLRKAIQKIMSRL
jgi:hypothetical protein